MAECPRCGCNEFAEDKVLWPDLIRTWELSPYEVEYIDRQQGFHCLSCGSSLRVMALVQAVLQAYSLDWPLESSISTLADKRVLEINTAGNLTSTLRTLPFHRLVEYPNVDMQSMPFADGEFDLIIHSDTLEHVADPKQALRECHRVLCDGGTMCFTVPIVLGRLSRSRLGMEASYHGSGTADFLVHSEFGSDVWTLLLASGFSSCTMTALELPSAIAITSRKEARHG